MKRAGLAVVALAGLGAGLPAAAAEPRGDGQAAVRQACRQFEDQPDEPAVRHKVPARLASFVAASETTITVERDSGTPACLDVSYGTIGAWSFLAGERLLGVAILGHEYNSYLIVDRAGSGAPIETGQAPIFSPSGRRFASVDVSEAAFGAFEALGAWEIAGDSIRRLAYVPGASLLEAGGDWRLERWGSEDCLVLSTAADPTDPERHERRFHELRWAAQQELKEVAEADGCRAIVR